MWMTITRGNKLRTAAVAVYDAYDIKDELKGRGWKFDGGDRCWKRVFAKGDFGALREALLEAQELGARLEAQISADDTGADALSLTLLENMYTKDVRPKPDEIERLLHGVWVYDIDGRREPKMIGEEDNCIE